MIASGVVALEEIGGDVADQRLEAPVPAEGADIEFGLRLDHPAEVARTVRA
ncbi:hypothetical protein D3C72_2290300 [compost metagenome]